MFKTTTPLNDDTGSGIVTQLFANDEASKIIDDNATIASGVSRGKVVKWSATNNRWELCNGTVALGPTDIIGICEYANGTSGQIRIGGVFTDDIIAANTLYYAQSTGAIGTTVTKVFVGRATSAKRLCMPAGGGLSPATTTTLGGVMVGTGISVDADGKISAPHGIEVFTASGTFTVPLTVTTVYVSMCGGGGRGGVGATFEGNPYGGGGGGGAHAVLKQAVTVTPGASISVTIGAGSSTTSAGETSSFGALVSCPGGSTGANSASGVAAGGAAGGAGGRKGDSGVISMSGAGGDCLFGIGGAAVRGSGAAAGLDGNGYGAGGSGSVVSGTPGNGSNGICIVEW